MHFKKFVAAEVPVEELKLFFLKFLCLYSILLLFENNYYLNEPSFIVGR